MLSFPCFGVAGNSVLENACMSPDNQGKNGGWEEADGMAGRLIAVSKYTQALKVSGAGDLQIRKGSRLERTKRC